MEILSNKIVNLIENNSNERALMLLTQMLKINKEVCNDEKLQIIINHITVLADEISKKGRYNN